MITQYFHCRQCVKDKPDGISHSDWAQQECGFNENGDLELRCKRHDMLIGVLDQTTLSAIKKMGRFSCGEKHPHSHPH